MTNDYISDYSQLAAGFDLNVSSKTMNIDGHREFIQLSTPFKSRADFVYPESEIIPEKAQLSRIS